MSPALWHPRSPEILDSQVPQASEAFQGTGKPVQQVAEKPSLPGSSSPWQFIWLGKSGFSALIGEGQVTQQPTMWTAVGLGIQKAD